MKTEQELIAEYSGQFYAAYLGNQDFVNSVHGVAIDKLQTVDEEAIGNEVTAMLCILSVGQAQALARTVLAATK